MQTEIGSILTLDNIEYVVANKINCNKNTYLFLMSTNQPIKVELIEEKKVNDVLNFSRVVNEEEKKYILSMISNKYQK